MWREVRKPEVETKYQTQPKLVEEEICTQKPAIETNKPRNTIKIQQSKLKYNGPISKYKQNQKPKINNRWKMQQAKQNHENKTQPKLVPSQKEPTVPKLVPTPEKPDEPTVPIQDTKPKPENIDRKPEQRKLFPIFSNTRPEKVIVPIQEIKPKPDEVDKKPEDRKLFPIFSKPTKPDAPVKTKTKTKKKTELDQNLAPNIKHFLQSKVRTRSESMPDTRARATLGENSDVPEALVYTCTQPQNGGTRHVDQKTT